MNIRNLALSLTLTGTTFAVTSFALSPAQAAIIKGSVGLSGSSIVTGDSSLNAVTINLNPGVVNSMSQSFTSLTGMFVIPGYGVGPFDPTNLSLSKNNGLNYFGNQQNAGAFINFGSQTIDGVTSNLQFWLNQPLTFTASFPTANQSSFTSSNFTGTFLFNGQSFNAEGWLNTSISGGSSTYQITLSTVEDVPEPTTLLGTGIALGIGSILKKYRQKK